MPTRNLFLALLLWALSPVAAWADVVILKDGFILHGKVRRENETIVDPANNQVIALTKLGGFYMVDDRARRLIFSFRRVQDVDDKDFNEGPDLVVLQRPYRQGHGAFMEPLLNIAGTTPWDDNWERVFKLRTANGLLQAQQRLVELTPHFARVQALRFHWSQYYLTGELGPVLVRDLLSRHPDLKEVQGMPDPVKRFKLIRFLIQAGWYADAEKELAQLRKQLPDQGAKVESTLEGLQRLRAQQLFDDIERARLAGRHRWVQLQLDQFPQEGTGEKLLDRVRAMKSQYETANDEIGRARRLLKDLPELVQQRQQQALFEEAGTAILSELNEENYFRLEPFLAFAKNAERDKKPNQVPGERAAELLALAVSGWLLGSGSAEAKVAVAEKLWRTRQFVLAYQKTHDSVGRQRMLDAYLKEKPLAYDEMARLIAFLPPPEPLDAEMMGSIRKGQKPETRPAEPLELQTELPGANHVPSKYWLQLPLEYRPGRSYPVLIVLHRVGEKARPFLDGWSAAAAQHGYFLVAPEWEVGLQPYYTFSNAEHAAVVDVVRDVRRRFAIDSDRVFLAGGGEGGTMAFDVGLSHPDLFAGVLPFSGRPRLYSLRYWRNAQNLPFYVVGGDFSGGIAKMTRRMFEEWIPRGYPALLVEYKGRGYEMFSGELPSAFDWMGRQKRAAAVPELGRNPNTGSFGEEYQTMRPTDNRFYWLSFEGLHDRHTNKPDEFSTRVVPAALQARILDGNTINVHARGVKQLTVWLARGMIDFTKPVTIRLNGRMVWNNRGQPVTPSHETLLEDFYQRGDRQRLYVAKVDFDRL